MCCTVSGRRDTDPMEPRLLRLLGAGASQISSVLRKPKTKHPGGHPHRMDMVLLRLKLDLLRLS